MFRRAIAAAAVVVAGCGHDAETAAPTQEGPRAGVIEGVVRLAAEAELPGWPTNPSSETRQAADRPSDCPPPTDAERFPVHLGAGRGLGPVVVVATGTNAATWPDSDSPSVHVVRIERCRLTPTTIVAERGDTLRVENPTTFPFFPDVGTGMMRAVIPTDPLEITLDQVGPRVVQCGFSNSCGRSDVVTFAHPIHALTSDDGHFRLEGVPLDQPVRVTAFHPVLGDVTADATFDASGVAHVELVVRPPTRQVDPAPTPLAPGEEELQ